MKNLVFIIIVIFISSDIIHAQFTKIGGGAGFTTGYHFHEMDQEYNKSGYFNIFAKGIYEMNMPVHIAPSIAYFIPHVWKETTWFDESKITVSTLMFDINGHYVFNFPERVELYGLAGLDILLAWKKDITKTTGTNPSEVTIKENDNAIGLNLGLGTYMKLTEQIDLNFEAKYLVSRYHQFMLNAGILINLQRPDKNENQGN